MRLGANPAQGAMLAAGNPAFPHPWAVRFLIAVGFWNFLGAGVFGFHAHLRQALPGLEVHDRRNRQDRR